MIILDEIYKKIYESGILSDKELLAVMQDRRLLAYILSNDFSDGYIISSHDVNFSLSSTYSVGINVLESGEAIIKAVRMEDDD